VPGISLRNPIRCALAQSPCWTQIGVAVAQLFPQFSLTGGVNWQSSLFPTWLQGNNRSLFIGPAATWPVFQGGAIVSNIHGQEALRDQAFITY